MWATPDRVLLRAARGGSSGSHGEGLREAPRCLGRGRASQFKEDTAEGPGMWFPGPPWCSMGAGAASGSSRPGRSSRQRLAASACRFPRSRRSPPTPIRPRGHPRGSGSDQPTGPGPGRPASSRARTPAAPTPARPPRGWREASWVRSTRSGSWSSWHPVHHSASSGVIRRRVGRGERMNAQVSPGACHVAQSRQNIAPCHCGAVVAAIMSRMYAAWSVPGCIASCTSSMTSGSVVVRIVVTTGR